MSRARRVQTSRIVSRAVVVSIYDGPTPEFTAETCHVPMDGLPATEDVAERLSKPILEQEQEIEDREARSGELQTTVAILEDLSIR